MKWLVALLLLSSSSIALAQTPSLSSFGDWFSLVSNAVLVVSIIVTLLVRIPFFKKRAGDLEGKMATVLRVLSFFPTFSRDPRTKALEAALKAVQQTEEEKKQIEQVVAEAEVAKKEVDKANEGKDAQQVIRDFLDKPASK